MSGTDPRTHVSQTFSVRVKKRVCICLFSFPWTLPEQGSCICELYVLRVRFAATEHFAKTAYLHVTLGQRTYGFQGRAKSP